MASLVPCSGVSRQHSSTVNGAVIDTVRSITNKRDYLLGKPWSRCVVECPYTFWIGPKGARLTSGEGSLALFMIYRPLTFPSSTCQTFGGMGRNKPFDHY